MKNIVGILREGRSKRGEKRVAVTPEYAKKIVDWGHKLIVQSAFHPELGDEKRAFADKEYKNAGAIISEDLSPAHIIFGLKEIFPARILPDKAYYFFSHTYKGQIKNRPMLKKLVENNSTVIDYELITDENDNRSITAFTYNAGYAGMVDTLWMLGKRLSLDGISNALELVPQAVEGQDLKQVKNIFHKVSNKIKIEGTPEKLPPIIVCFLGKGKTAFGAREMFNILPHQDISINDLAEVIKSGSRKKLYVLQLGTESIYRLKSNSRFTNNYYNSLVKKEKKNLFYTHPNEFESNLDNVLPFITILMNCIVWSSKYPRTVTKSLLKKIYKNNKTLKAIGDITCDPNGSLEFSKETWIDNPVFIYNPSSEKVIDGFAGDGVAVMAVTNLPCEFSADASRQFSDDLAPFIKPIITADYSKSLEESNLPPEIKRAVILWKGKFTKKFIYMKEYLV